MVLFRVLSKFRRILSRHQKIRIVELAVLMIVAGFMETLSVALIIPFIEFILNPDQLMENRYVKMVSGLFGIESYRMFLVFLALLMAVLYIVKNAFLLFQLTIQNRFTHNNMLHTQQRMLRSYLLRPYEYYLEVQSGEVLRVIGSDTATAYGVLTSILSLFSELLVSFALMIAVFAMAPGPMLFMGVILIFVTVSMQKYLRPVMEKSGKISMTTTADMNRWLLQAIQGIKEVKITHCEEYFEKNYERSGRAYVGAQYKRMTWASTPRYMLEATAMSIFFVIMAFMIYSGRELGTILPMLSGVAMAAIRLLPAANRISTSMSIISYSEPAVDKLLENLQDVSQYEKMHVFETAGTSGKAVIDRFSDRISLSDVTYCYPTGDKNVLNHAEMEIQKGMSVGIVGTSGAGKTTAVDVMLGLLRPQKGKVTVDGTDIALDIDGWLSNIGYIPQSIFMLDGDIRENVAFGVREEEIDDDRVWEALKEAALDEFVKTLPEGVHTQIGERGVRLSGGQRQRIGIARALYTDPSILVFDEATSALDNETEAAIMESINHLHGRKTMVIIAHRLTTIQGCDVIYRVENGGIKRER